MRSTLIFISFFFISRFTLAQWMQTNGPYGGNVTAFATYGNDLYAGTQEGWAWRTSDNGNSWNSLNLTPYSSTTVSAFVFKDSMLFAADNGRVFRSTDFGNSWAYPSGPNCSPILDLAVSGNDIFTASWGCGIYRSSDDGNTWNLVNNGLGYLYISSFAVKGSIIYAGANYGSVDSCSLYKSSNNGNSWTADSTGLNGAFINSLEVIGTELYAATDLGVYRRTASSWILLNNGLIHYNTYRITGFGNHLVAGSNTGYISYSSDYGSTWTTSSQLSSEYMGALTMYNNEVFAGTYTHGVFKSSDWGVTWTQANQGLSATTVNVMAVLDTTIVAGMLWGGIHISSDRGNTWNIKNSGLTNIRIKSLAVNDSIVFAGTEDGLFRSHDHCNSWIPSDQGISGNNIQKLVQTGNKLFAAVYSQGVYLSQDNGVTWTLKNNGLNTFNFNFMEAVDTCLLAGTTLGLFRSTDYGDTWVKENVLIGDSAIQQLFVFGDSVFVRVNNSKYISSDLGNTWLPTSSFMYGLDCGVAVGGGNIFIGAYTGINRSTDNGNTWSFQNNGLLTGFKKSTSLIMNDTVLYSGIRGRGIFKNANWICANTSSVISPVACGSYTSPSGNTWTTTATFTDTITNAGGCDSVITVQLTINNNPIVIATASGPVTFCYGDSVVLAATPGFVSYQWYNRNYSIPGATSVNYIAKSGGRYKCIAQNAAICSDTSNIIIVNLPCIPPAPNEQRTVSIAEINIQPLKVSPNPGIGTFLVESPPGQLHIFNSTGKLIISTNAIDEKYLLEMSEFPDGIYFAQLRTKDIVYYTKILLSRN